MVPIDVGALKMLRLAEQKEDLQTEKKIYLRVLGKL